MKTRPQIGPHEYEAIFARLKKKSRFGSRPSTWKTRRNGWTIRMWPVQTAIGIKIGWQMSKHLRQVHAISCTLTGAIEAVNEVLQPKVVEKGPVETLPLSAPYIRKEWVPKQARQEWLPYADK